MSYSTDPRLFYLKSQVVTDSVLVENHYRTFHYTNPVSKIKAYTLVFVLHGSGGDGKTMIKPAMNLEKLSAQQRIFLVYPDGYKNYWNECRKAATSVANLENVNEQAFFNSMMKYFTERYQVNDQYFLQ